MILDTSKKEVIARQINYTAKLTAGSKLHFKIMICTTIIIGC